MIGLVKAAAMGANPAGALLQLLWKPLLVLALVGGAAWWTYHRGYEAGDAHRAKVAQAAIDGMKLERDAAAARAELALGANRNLAASERALRTANAELASENARLKQDGAAAVARAEKDKHVAEQSLAQWRAKYSRIAKTPDCSAALATLARACPVGSY